MQYRYTQEDKQTGQKGRKGRCIQTQTDRHSDRETLTQRADTQTQRETDTTDTHTNTSYKHTQIDRTDRTDWVIQIVTWIHR